MVFVPEVFASGLIDATVLNSLVVVTVPLFGPAIVSVISLPLISLPQIRKLTPLSSPDPQIVIAALRTAVLSTKFRLAFAWSVTR